MPYFTASLVIAELESLDGRRAWSAGDPYVVGVFDEVAFKPVLEVRR